MAAHLFIVSRQHPDLFAYLSNQFAQEPDVHVMLDRRQGERRRGADRRTFTRGERRQADRRTMTVVTENLTSLGYAFVRIPADQRAAAGVSES
jgi:hypothetical protein